MNSRFPTMLLLLVALAGLTAGGCGTQIGDECQTDFACGAANICDLTAPEGYCTRTPCRNRGCEGDEAVCVQFQNGESYCMHGCASKGDCREGYACLEAGPQGACADTGGACVTQGASARSYCYVE